LSPATALALQRIHLLLGGNGIQLQIGLDETNPAPVEEETSDSANLTTEHVPGQAG
jgi:hypothetical protein